MPAVAGLPAEELYPVYNQVGQLSGLGGAEMYASGITYLSSGQVGQISRSGQTTSTLNFTYAPGTRQLASLRETSLRGTVFTQQALREYTRNDADIITRASTSADAHTADVQCYLYDAMQALTDAWTPASGDCATGPTAARGGPAPYRTWSLTRFPGHLGHDPVSRNSS